MSPLLTMVEVAVDGGHPTTRKHAGPVPGFDMATLPGIGPPSGDAVVHHLAGVGMGQSPPPFSSGLGFCDLAGDVGNDRPITGQLSRIPSESGQGGQVDVDIDNSAPAAAGMVLSVQKV